MLLVAALLTGEACRNPVQKQGAGYDFRVDTSKVTTDTVMWNDENLQIKNDEFYLNGFQFSGYVLDVYPNGKRKVIAQVYLGKRHGTTRSFYSSGKLFEQRMYKNNRNTGRHYGYWENGLMKFDYLYFEDKRAGDMKQWYQTGQPYIFAHYKEDKEDGLQRAWRQNGKLFANYVVKEGIAYGLQETTLCYTLEEGKLKKPQE